jgi:hypothetical protein
MRSRKCFAHGCLTSNAMAAPLGMVFHSTAIAYVEHHIRFIHPVRAGDTPVREMDGQRIGTEAEARGRAGYPPRDLHESGRKRSRQRRGQAAGAVSATEMNLPSPIYYQ